MELPYLAYFGLKEEPFSTVPSPRYFFLTSTHSTALEKTAFVVGARKGLAVVFGDTGSGKSSLARLLHQKFLDAGFVSSLLINPNYPTPNSLLRTIAQELGTPQTSRSFKGTLDLFKAHVWANAAVDGKTMVLIIDDYSNATPAGPWTPATKSVLSRLKSQNLVDGVGIQFITNGLNPPNREGIIATMQDYGVAVYVTEMAVHMHGYNGPEYQRLQRQADIYRSIVQAAIDSGRCRSFTFWGTGDKYAAFNSGPDDVPSLFDDELNPKPAYYAVLDVLRTAAR